MSTSIIGTRSQPATRQFRDNYDRIWRKDSAPPRTDHTAMEPQMLLAVCGSDAKKWAEAFKQYWPDKTPDVDTLVGWFANAIMRALDEDRWRRERAEHTTGA